MSETMIDLDQCIRTPLPRTPTYHCAVAARAMGLQVGDWIWGRSEIQDWWSERVLLLLWLGEEVAVWRSWSRNSRHPEWQLQDRESASWGLSARRWYKLTLPQTETEPADQPRVHRITYEVMQSNPQHAGELARTGLVEVVDDTGERVTIFGAVGAEPPCDEEGAS